MLVLSNEQLITEPDFSSPFVAKICKIKFCNKNAYAFADAASSESWNQYW